MDIGVSQIVGVVASGTTQYLFTYAPIFIFAAGLVLALGIMAALISILTRKKIDVFDDDGL